MSAAACSPAGRPAADDGVITVLATTGMVADVARTVGGEQVRVTALMGPGVDPHLYKASAGDLARLNDADVVFYNGLFLEGKMAEIFKKLGRGGRPVVALGDAIEHAALRQSDQFQGHPDPHIWFDVSVWARTVDRVVATLSELRPAHADEFRANGERYKAELAELHAWCAARIAEIPPEARVMITAHDAFGYFGQAYGIEVIGLQGINTTSEYGIADVQRLVSHIVERRIKAVFIESSVPRRSIEAVVQGCLARGHQVVIGGELFSDAMGEEGTPEGNYIGMVRHNVDTIVAALK
jgi:manganese/zinc/iron transport system substrate-binding protein